MRSKIFTLLVTSLMVLSVSATPVKKSHNPVKNEKQTESAENGFQLSPMKIAEAPISTSFTTGDKVQWTSKYNADWTDNAATDGWFQLMNPIEEDWIVSISTENSPRTTGEFDAADLDADYTYIKIWDEQQEEYVALVPTDMHAVLSKDTNGIITGVLTIDDQTTGKTYEATLKHDPSKRVPLLKDTDEAVNVHFEYAEVVQLYAKGTTATTKKTLTLRTLKADKSYQLHLILYAASADADITIPEGEYTFSTASTELAGTALASSGITQTQTGSSITPSYLGATDGQYITDLWFFRTGKITVKKVTIDDKPTLYMVIEGKNSVDKDVKVTIGRDPSSSGINDIKGDAAETLKVSKVIENGIMFIEREGVRYNLQGIRVK